MNTRTKNRVVHFAIVDDRLLRTVTDLATDKRYRHRCEQSIFETVAHAVHETPEQGQGTNATIIAQQEDLPFTQVHVAMAFLKERGLVTVRCRRTYPCTPDTYLDAMVEWHALTPGSPAPGSPAPGSPAPGSTAGPETSSGGAAGKEA